MTHTSEIAHLFQLPFRCPPPRVPTRCGSPDHRTTNWQVPASPNRRPSYGEATHIRTWTTWCSAVAARHRPLCGRPRTSCSRCRMATRAAPGDWRLRQWDEKCSRCASRLWRHARGGRTCISNWRRTSVMIEFVLRMNGVNVERRCVWNKLVV